MEARTVRVFWSNASTGWLNFTWHGVITANSVVHISACEYFSPENSTLGAEGVIRNRGEATIWVKNIRPYGPNPGDFMTGGVEFFLQIDREMPMRVATDITVLGEPENKIIK